ncbi:MAG: tetratricopeptide repeat protein, partial [Deltaproteobacteria bacterium]|nr:tetratricopeptide repeat protein [Deltaproteobacteria bacterium]
MEQAYRQDPDNLKIVDTLAQTYQELGQFQRAQELYQEALARQGSNLALQNNWCFSFYLQGDLAKAESCFKEALTRDPGNAAARNNLGLLWCRQGKLAEAQRLWEETEGTGAAQNRLNQALAFLGKSPPARYAKATESKPAPPTQAAAPQKPVVPVTPASPAKPVVAEAKAPVKAPASALPVAAPPKTELQVAAKTPEPKPAPLPQAAAPPKPATRVIPASPPKSVVAEAKTPVKAPAPAQPVAAPPKAELQPAAKPATRPAPLTVAERAAGIEVRNGTRTKNLAHLTRALLSQEGFNVTQIGNHIDFGAEATVIYYRAGAEKLAQALNFEIFPEAKLEQSATLKNGAAIKVLLGQDLLNQPRVMTRLTGERLAESPPAVNAKALAAGPQPQSAASKEPAAPVIVAAPAKAGPDKPQIQAVALAARPTAKNQAAAETANPKGPLTAAELMATLIEIRNGTRSQNLAHRA